jgi:hypothetical protein
MNFCNSSAPGNPRYGNVLSLFNRSADKVYEFFASRIQAFQPAYHCVCNFFFPSLSYLSVREKIIAQYCDARGRARSDAQNCF